MHVSRHDDPSSHPVHVSHPAGSPARRTRRQVQPGMWREAHPLHAVYEAGKILAGPRATGRTLLPVLNVLASFMNLRQGAVALLVEPGDRLDDGNRNPYVIAATTLIEAPQPPDCGAIPRRVAETVLKTGVAIAIQNMALECPDNALPPCLRDQPDPVALLAVPICERELSPHTLGVLAAYRVLEGSEPFRLDQDLRVLTMVANLMGQSLRFRRMVARDRERLMREADSYGRALAGGGANARPTIEKLPDIVGDSPAIRAVSERIRKVAPTRSTVLLRGESGTGKELFARALHKLSSRADGPFVKVNCAALSETLLETELFGHEKGAFTGAISQRKGRFELADGGTLFLDEIGDISTAFQAKLLRALQEGEFERVGSSRTVRVDVRLIAATNKDLETAVANGEFRADLYFRICVIPIVLPPLRERSDDIPQLAQQFLDRFNEENGTKLRLGPAAIDVLRNCFFPGNVRELENCINRVAALAAGPEIDPNDIACQQDACLSARLWSKDVGSGPPIGGLSLPVLNPPRLEAPPLPRPDDPGQRKRSPREELIEAMERSGWVQAKAARLLGLTPRQLGYALKKHSIDIKKF